MSNQNNSSVIESSARSNKQNFMEKLLSAVSQQDPDQSYYDMQQVLEEMDKDQANKQQIMEDINQLFTPHKVPRIAEVEKELEQIIIQINNLQICDPTTFQVSIQKIKSVKRVITQIVDKYFQNLKNQYNYITNELVQNQIAPIKKLIYTLRKDLKNYDETNFLEIQERQNYIKEQFNYFKQQLPKDINVQINSQSVNDIKDSLFKLISISFKEQFKIVPNYFNGFKPQKKNIVSLKNKNGNFKLQEQQNSIYSYRNNILYHSHIEYIDHIKQQELIIHKDVNKKLLYCNLINTSQHLYFIGQLYQDINTQQIQFTQYFTKYSKLENKIEFLQDIPIQTYGGQSIKCGQFIYYWGGYIMAENQQLGSKKGFKYNMNDNTWEQIDSMQYPRIKGQCCIIENMIYIAGGLMNQYQGNWLVEIFDTIIMHFKDSFELQQSYIPQLLGYAFPISQQEILILGGYNQYGNEGDAQLINLFLKTIQKNNNKLQRIQNVNCTQPIIHKQLIHLFNSEDKKIEYIKLSSDTLEIKNIIQL